MRVPFVHSGYARKPHDHYPTIDRRCVDGFLAHVRPATAADVCAPNGSGIVETLVGRGVKATCVADAFTEEVDAEWVVTNPPYDKAVVDKIIYRQIDRLCSGQVEGVAMLLRSGFDFAVGRTAMFARQSFYAGQIKLQFRPWWVEKRDKQPIHSYVWQLWRRDAVGKEPVVLYADGVIAIDWDDRQWLAMPAEMVVLERFATQAGQVRSRKPARLVWLYTQGKSREEITADLRVAEATMTRWFNRWIDYGVPGLTGLYHPELEIACTDRQPNSTQEASNEVE